MKKQHFSLLAIALLIIAIAVYAQFLPYPVEDFSKDETYKVLEVTDGDTVKIQYQGKATKVRLIGVDTPETVHPNKPVGVYGKEASAFTRNLLLGESVYLRFDTRKTDNYGRLLAYLYRAPDGLFVNLEIVRQGYGHPYTQFAFKHLKLFQHYGNKAREINKGLYAAQPVPIKEKESDTTQKSIVYITKSGSKYHRANCSSLRKSKIPMSLDKAKLSYGPCSKCNPPR